MSRVWDGSRKARWAWYGQMSEHIWRECSRPVMRLDDPAAPDMGDWGQVLAHWGIAPEDAQYGVRVHARRLVFWLLILVLAIVVAANDIAMAGGTLHGKIAFFSSAPTASFGCLTACWRISMYRARCFVPLWRWIAAGFQVPKGLLYSLPPNACVPVRVEVVR